MRDDRRTRGRELLAEWECAQLALCELRGLSAQQLSPLRLWLLLAKLALDRGVSAEALDVTAWVSWHEGWAGKPNLCCPSERGVCLCRSRLNRATLPTPASCVCEVCCRDESPWAHSAATMLRWSETALRHTHQSQLNVPMNLCVAKVGTLKVAHCPATD